MVKISIIERVAPYFAVLWIMCVINSVIAWYSFSPFLRYTCAFCVILSSFTMRKQELSKGRILLSFLLLLYFLWISVNGKSYKIFFTEFVRFVPFIFILFWPIDVLKKLYDIFRIVVIFFAIGSSVITILSYMGLISYIPHYVSSAHSNLHVNREDFYNIYIVFPVLMGDSVLYQRACGMMEEPGHFSIVLGFIYLIDRYMHRKINLVIIICAILTFSPVFFFIMFFTELVVFFKYWKKTLTYGFLIVGIGVITYYILPNIQKTVDYFVFEKNVNKIYNVLAGTNKIDETLDERANHYGMNKYARMSFEEKLVGGKTDRDVVLSDYRGFILSKGLIGLCIVSIISLFSIQNAPFNLKISLLLTLFIIMLHRSWFFYEPFPFIMSYLACSFSKNKEKCFST